LGDITKQALDTLLSLPAFSVHKPNGFKDQLWRRGKYCTHLLPSPKPAVSPMIRCY
jgi:hypothetical protein